MLARTPSDIQYPPSSGIHTAGFDMVSQPITTNCNHRENSCISGPFTVLGLNKDGTLDTTSALHLRCVEPHQLSVLPQRLGANGTLIAPDNLDGSQANAFQQAASDANLKQYDTEFALLTISGTTHLVRYAAPHNRR